ncbi:hypothetical protein BN77_1293 [Rhizobium mesoamericanum STM3625]|uniref:Uncharacterized protein n=1 Tax=Rhizobium mesoamericanum STM3625 TaxID=1211777 RepID=K0PCA5_9HYPH|nr:hypothetical protein BN77_1293 [Rhizobium mesoamericanum STM3625]
MVVCEYQFTPRLPLIQALRAIPSKIGRSSRLQAPWG